MMLIFAVQPPVHKLFTVALGVTNVFYCLSVCLSGWLAVRPVGQFRA